MVVGTTTVNAKSRLTHLIRSTRPFLLPDGGNDALLLDAVSNVLSNFEWFCQFPCAFRLPKKERNHRINLQPRWRKRFCASQYEFSRDVFCRIASANWQAQFLCGKLTTHAQSIERGRLIIACAIYLRDLPTNFLFFSVVSYFSSRNVVFFGTCLRPAAAIQTFLKSPGEDACVRLPIGRHRTAYSTSSNATLLSRPARYGFSVF